MFEKLIDKGLIEGIAIYKDEIQHLLDAAEKDLKTAAVLKGTDSDWSFNIAYNAMFRVSLACMYAEGYRPRGENKHKATMDFLQEALGPEFEKSILRLDGIRKKRNKITYQASLEISRYEMDETLKFAKGYISAVSELVKKKIMP